MNALWRVLAVYAIGRFAPDGVVDLDCDDTLFHKSGRAVDGAGAFRDAVRSTIGRVVHALGLNLVMVTLRVSPPWSGQPIAVPVNARLHRKHDTTTTVAHAAAMIAELAGCLPDRVFHLCADGAYATLAGANLPRTHLTSRMRRDAALYESAPPRTGKRGRPRTKGDRLPTPPELADQVRNRDWKSVTVDVSGRSVERLVWVRDVLWYRVNKHDLVRLVIVRDPAGVEPDDYFITTDTTATGAQVASRYAGRWSIEVGFRDVKQDLGGQHPQSWKRRGPERAACLSLWLHALIWCWYLDTHPTGQTWTPRPWYRAKASPSFLDALAALRRVLWSPELHPCPTRRHRTPKSPTRYSTRSPTRHEPKSHCESPLAESDREEPYRPHLPHPRAYWAYAIADVRVVGAPANPAGGERIVEVLTLPPAAAAEYIAKHDPVHADVLRHAQAMGLVRRTA